MGRLDLAIRVFQGTVRHCLVMADQLASRQQEQADIEHRREEQAEQGHANHA